jgi:hypothetical protein
VDFNVRIPFKIGLPKLAVTQEKTLSAFCRGTNDDDDAEEEAQQQQQHQHPPQSVALDSVASAAGNNDSSYASSAFHEVPDIRDEEEEEVDVTEEMSVVDEEQESDDDNDEYSTTSASSATSSSAQTERASALNVSVRSSAGDAQEGALSSSLRRPQGDFEAQPCCRRRTRMVEFSFPAATRVSVRLLQSVNWEHHNKRGRDVLLLPLETTSSSAEVPTESPAAPEDSQSLATDPSSAGSASKLKRSAKDELPLLLQGSKIDRGGALTHNGPCRVVIPSLAQESAYMVPGEVTAHVQLTLDTRWSSEWTIAVLTAQRTVAERLLGWMEARTHSSIDDAPQQRRSRVARCALLRGGLKVVSTTTAAGASSEDKAYAAAAAAPSAVTAPTSASAPAAATSTSAGAGVEPFIAALLEMPVAALRARVRCHTVHAEGVRATLVIIAHAFLQDRHGYLHGDPLTWHTAAWSEAVRRVSLASNAVGAAAVSGEAAMEVALFFLLHVAGCCTAASMTRAQVIDAAIDLMSIPGLSFCEVKAVLDDRRQIGSVMWIAVDLLTKCLAVSRAPKHMALVAQATRRLLLLGCTATQFVQQSSALPPLQPHDVFRPSAAGTLLMNASVSSTAAAAASAAGTLAAAVGGSGAPTDHYLSIVNSCGRATEANLRRGVHGLLTQLFRLLKALLHRIQSTQAAPHRFLLESWEYGAFAVFTISLMSTPMDATDVQLCAPFFSDVVTGLLPSFTRLSRTESLLLTSESEEHKFLVEVARHVRGHTSSAAVAGDGMELGEVDTPAAREPQIVREAEETRTTASITCTNRELFAIWDVLLDETASSWTPGHVRVEIWDGSCAKFFVGLASTNVPAVVSGPESDSNGIYFMGDGTLQYGNATRKQRRLPRWYPGDVVELNFIFARGNWDVVMALNGVSMVRLTLPRRNFRLVAASDRSREDMPGFKLVHVVTVSPIYRKAITTTADKRRRHALETRAAPALPSTSSSSPSTSATVPADIRLSPFLRLTVFNVSLFLELVLHYLVLHSSRQQYNPVAMSSVATPAAGNGGSTSLASHAGHPPPPQLSRGLPRRTVSSASLAGASFAGDNTAASATTITPLTNAAAGVGQGCAHLVQVCTAPLQHSIQQLVHLLHDLSPSGDRSNNGSASGKGERDSNKEAADKVKRTAAQHISNAMLLDLVVTLSISLPMSTSMLAMTVDVLTAVVECEAVARKTRTVALSALYNAITQHMFSEAISPMHAGAVRRLWTACCGLASETFEYQPRFSPASVPASSVVVFAGGRRIEHRRVSASTTLSGNVRSVSYACNPIRLDDHETAEVVRVSVRIQRGFPCETLGRYYYFGLADVASTPAPTPADQGNANSSSAEGGGGSVSGRTAPTTVLEELKKHPGERAKQRRTYYISDYLSEVPDVAVQMTDTDRVKNYLNPESSIIFGSGDVVTAVVYVRERCISFERNGLPLNVLYRDIPSSVRCLYPFVELYNRDSRAKWMYAPDEAAMSARYTMRAMLLSWPRAVLPLVKECLQRLGSRRSAPAAVDEQGVSTPSNRSVTDSTDTSGSSSHSLKEQDSADANDVVLGVLGADGDEMRMVYVPPPQLDQPGGRARSVRVERFERGMAVVSDEAGSLQRVCAAALEPDTTEEVHVLPSSTLRSAVQACLPELALLATQCLQELGASESAGVDVAKEEGRGTSAAGPHTAATTTTTSAAGKGKRSVDASPTRQVVLHRPATLLRVLRLIFNLNGSAAPTGPAATVSVVNRSVNVSPQADALSLPSASATLTLAEPTERAMMALLPLLGALLPGAQLDLPSPVLLREAWNELWCNPHLRRQVGITVPCCTAIASFSTTHSSATTTTAGAKDGDADKRTTSHLQRQQQPDQRKEDKSGNSSTGSLSTNLEEIDYTYAEPAGITYGSSAQRFDDRVRAYRVDGSRCLCPSCGKRWSACTSYHTVPSSWCDLLDRVLRLLHLQDNISSLSSAAQRSTASSPYCGWFGEWTDGPLEVAAVKEADAPSGDATSRDLPDAATPPTADEDGPNFSPALAQSLSDARLAHDADDTTTTTTEEVGGVEEAAGGEDDSDAQAQWTDASDVPDTVAVRSEDDGAGGSSDGAAAAAASQGTTSTTTAATAATAAAAVTATESSLSATADKKAPITLVVRRAQKPVQTEVDNGGHYEDDGRIYVEGSGETMQCTFTFTGSLVSPTQLRGQMIFDRIDLPDVEREPSDDEEWECPICTLLNEPSALRCAICANARPRASWTCPVCSYAYNALSSVTCATCGRMRPGSLNRLNYAAGPSGYCTRCHQREHFRNFHAMRSRHFCTSCCTVTRWLPEDRYSTTIEARLVGDGGLLEFQWALDGYNTVCFGLRTRAYNADVLWNLVDTAARRRGSSAVRELGRYVPPIPERPLSTPSSRPIAAAAGLSTASAAEQPILVGAIVYYASALMLQYARLLPVEQLAEPDFLRCLHVCGSEWLDSWAQFPTSAVTSIFLQCLKLLQDGVREPELVSTVATVALTLIRQQPDVLGAEKHALLYALCLNVVRYGDAAQRKASYTSISALMEDDPAAALNVQPLVPVLSMQPLLEGQQRATVLALLHHATMTVTPAIAKACACMARTVEAMQHQRPLPPMLGRPFPYLVALTETRLNEGGELLVGQVRGSVGVAPNKGGKYYYEVEVPHEFISDRSMTIVMGWGTLEHERMASAQHVGSDLHSWGFNCREHLRLMMTEQAMPVPRRPNQGDVIGSMMDLETMMVCWTINGQEISWVSVPAQGDGEEIYPYVSALVEPQSVKIRLGNTRFKPAGYQDYTPPSDRDLWSAEDTAADANNDGGSSRSSTAGATSAKTRVSSPPSHPPQSYEFYQQLSLALEEASITTFDDTSILSLLDTTTARSVLRQYPKLLELMSSAAAEPTHDTEQKSGRTAARQSPTTTTIEAAAGREIDVQLLLPYIKRLRRAQELTIVVARHLSLIEKSPYLMSCYKKATDLLFSSGRWTIFELQPGGRPKYSGGHAFCVLVSVRRAKHIRREADAEWLAQHPGLTQQQQRRSSPSTRALGAATSTGNESSDSSPSQRNSTQEAAASHDGVSSTSSANRRVARQHTREGEDSGVSGTPSEETEEDFVDVYSNEDAGADDASAGGLAHSASLAELRNALQDIYGDDSHLTLAERRLRCSVTGQLFTQLEKTRVYQQARMFAVRLEGALAVDAGGVTRAVMSMVGEELSYRFIRGVRVDPLLPLFQLCSHSTIFTVVPNMSALYASEAADDGAEGGLLRRMYEWLGKLMGNMVLCGTLKVPFDFPRMLWKTLTFQEDTITLADYAYDIDDNITAALEDDEFVLSDEFFAALPEHVRASPAFLKSLQSGVSSSSGDTHMDNGEGGVAAVGHHVAMPSTRPLRPYVCMTPAMSMQDMSHLALEELEEYAANAEAAEVSRRRALAQEALLHQYDPAFLAIRAGMTSVVPASSLRSVQWEDLRARVCGNGAASTEHVLAELDMSPLPPSMRAMLTQVLNSFTESQLSRFLLFCTGQSRIPLPEKVLVNCGDEAGRLPTAHTCSPISLLLQPCSSAAELQNSLEACLTHASEFGFV